MSEDKLTLEIVTPLGVALHETVDQVEAPSVAGELGVLPGHLPLLAGLRMGLVTLHSGADETRLAVADGFVEVSGDRVLLLTDKFARRDDVDPVAVKVELREASDKLEKFAGDPGSPQWRALVADENWAAVRLELYGEPPAATQRPYEEFGPPANPEESDQIASEEAPEAEAS